MRSLFLFLLFISLGLRSQTDSLQRPLDKTNRYFSFNYDNDFFTATDRYYTQGVYLDLILPIFSRSPIAKILIKSGKNSQNYFGLTARQDCFTPGSIRYDTLNYLDRPYAATMYLSQYLISIHTEKKRRINSKLDLGIIGPCAVCEEEQKGIHRALVNIQPLGWENQLSTDYIVNYSLGLEQGLFTSKYFEAIALGDLRAGTIYDDASVGLMLRGGFMAGYFKQLGVIKNATKNKFQLYAFAKGKTKFVGYNATIEGGLFSKDIHQLPPSSINRYVLQGTYGIVFAYKRFSAEYTKVFESPEFLKGRYHGYGRCALTFCF
jgi:lipid A 3-O-deacylase